MILKLITPDILEEYWPKIRPMVVDACKTSCGKYEAIDIMKEAMSEAMQLWVVEDDGIQCLTITTNIQFPRSKVCKLICCIGDGRDKWINFLKDIEIWAKKQGCHYMEPECRKGWGKVLKPLGYEGDHILLHKVLA